MTQDSIAMFCQHVGMKLIDAGNDQQSSIKKQFRMGLVRNDDDFELTLEMQKAGAGYIGIAEQYGMDQWYQHFPTDHDPTTPEKLVYDYAAYLDLTGQIGRGVAHYGLGEIQERDAAMNASFISIDEAPLRNWDRSRKTTRSQWLAEPYVSEPGFWITKHSGHCERYPENKRLLLADSVDRIFFYGFNGVWNHLAFVFEDMRLSHTILTDYIHSSHS